MKVSDESTTRVEYRYLPLSIDQWFKESQYAASDVMNSLIEDTNGYCDMGGGEVIGGEEDATPQETDAPVFAESSTDGGRMGEPQVMFT